MRRTRALIAASLIVAAALVPLGAAPAAAECEVKFPYGETIFSGSAGQQAFFSMPGLCLGATGTWTVNSISGGGAVAILADGSAGAGFTVAPDDDTPRRIGVSLTLVAGDLTRSYLLVAWLGLESPLTWPTGPVPNAAELPVVDPTPGRTSTTFTLPGAVWPQNVECEVLVRSTPRGDDFDVITDPPNFTGRPIEIGIQDYGEPFIGVVSVTYSLLCRPYMGFSEAKFYTIDLYIGVPIPPPPAPLLPPTGGEAPLAPWALLGPVGALLVLAAWWRRRTTV